MPSFDRPSDTDIAPSPWVVRFSARIKAGGVVLDLACGHGRHTRYLLSKGYRVVAADLDISGLSDLAGLPAVEIVAADLEAGTWPLEGRRFDGIVVTNYLHRPHLQRLPEALAENGVLIIETFGEGNETLGRPRNPAFLLRAGELLAAFAPVLHVVAYEHGREDQPRPAVRQRLCAIRGAGPVLLTGG
jgi:SAM-dependent methyltransferase